MKNVTRLSIPTSLENNGGRWTEELLDELRKGAEADKKRLKTFYGRYNKRDVKSALKRMYNKLCCYCESRIENVTKAHIEHRKPKSRDKFPECTFEWDNLHLVCPNCNNLKGDQWDGNNPILDCVTDVPISKHLSYWRFYRYPLSERGKTTRDHAQLDREELIEPRLEIYWQVMDIIEEFNNNPNAPGSDIADKKLSQLSKGQFGSFIEYLRKTFMTR